MTTLEEKLYLVETAMGQRKAELVLKNATYVNVFSNELCQGDIAVSCGKIVGIGDYSGQTEVDVSGKIVCPGFMDAHIHLESSLVSPAEFVKAVLPHGTTTLFTDPHEIANIMGTDGIRYMLQATEGLPLDVRFLLPSCVPATPLDEAGAVLGWQDIDGFYARERVQGLAEMMNAFGVVHGDRAVHEKIAAAQSHGKCVDGHAPGLTGKELNAYIASGVASDHECSNLDEAMEKLRLGQYIMIREGTAARNLNALAGLLKTSGYDRCLFCTDDKHPIDLLKKGHMDDIIRSAIALGVEPVIAVRAATRNTAEYFGLRDRGAVAPGCRADLVVIDGFETFRVERVYQGGRLVCEMDRVTAFSAPSVEPVLVEKAKKTFHLRPLRAEDFATETPCGVIGLVPGEIISTNNGFATGIDTAKDILRMAVIERHQNTGHIGLGYLQGYGLKEGAVATSVAHDSHNLIVVGTNETDMAFAANRIRENGGGIVVVKDGRILGEVQLELAGIMTDDSVTHVNDRLEQAKSAAVALGVSKGIDPFMTLSFMSLPVIPALRLTTRGVLDVESQTYVTGGA